MTYRGVSFTVTLDFSANHPALSFHLLSSSGATTTARRREQPPDQQKNEDAECDMFFADLDFDDSMLSLGAANLEDDEVFGDILASMILG